MHVLQGQRSEPLDGVGRALNTMEVSRPFTFTFFLQTGLDKVFNGCVDSFYGRVI